MSATSGRSPSVRALLLALAAVIGATVIGLGAYVVITLAPAARGLHARTGVMAAEYDSLRAETERLQSAFLDVRALAGNGKPTAADRAGTRALHAALVSAASRSVAVQASLLLSDIPQSMRLSLADAAGTESHLAGMLVEALQDLEQGERGSARRWVARADTVRTLLRRQLDDAQQNGLADLATRERVLGERAGRVSQGVAVWVVLGAALVGLAMLVVQRRLYAPLAALDGGFARVARGDLDATLRVRRDDELGRLTAHFNEMTAVLRARPEVEALRASEVRFRSLIEHSMDLISIVGPDGRFKYASPAVARLLGYAQDDLIGHLGFEYVHPDDRPRVEAAFARAIADRASETREEYRFRHKDGTWRHFDSVVTNLVGEPTVAGLVINSRDVTERRQAEETLQRERFLVDTLLEHVPDPIYFKDIDSRFIRVNRALALRAGLRDPADAIGKTDADLFTPEHAAAARRDEVEIMRTGRAMVNQEEKETWPDGRVTWVLSTKMPLRAADGTVVGTFGVSRDVTERREAERRLQDSETRFRTAFMTGTDAYLIVGRDDGRIVEANDQFLTMYGFRRGEVIGRTSLELGLWAQPEARQELLAGLAGRGLVRNFEVLARRKNGETFPVLYSIASLPGEGPPLLMGVIRDVTEQKRSAEALRSLEEQFRQAQRLEAVGRLAGGVAHDFNNILTAITGYTELLLDEFRANDPRREDLEQIRVAAERASGLTRQLLAFSRKQVLQPRVLDLNEVIRGLEKMLHRIIGEDVKLAFTPGADLGTVRADPGQIEQVVLNLAVNARDAMPDGGHLTIETANVELGEAYVREHAGTTAGPYVMLAVSDTGIGMDVETRAHIFEPFFTTKEQGKGTGLGLATVHGIVTQSGGHIQLYSEPGHGTAFKIYLPRSAGGTAPAAAEPPAPPSSGGGETVLVAEDDRAVRELVASALTQRGYRVLRAPDGQTAMEMARSAGGQIDLLLTDIVMPGMTGRALGEALKAGHAGLKVLYMSGYTDDAVLRHGVLQNGMPFLQKPFTPEALARMVRDVLDQRRSGETGRKTGR